MWFIFGGGTYTFRTLAYQAEFYRNIALTDPYNSGFGTVLPATLFNVAERSLPIWADLFIVSNGLAQIDALGIRNLAISLFFGLIAAWLLYRYHKKTPLPLLVILLYLALLIAPLPLVTVVNFQFVVVAALPSLAFFLLLAIRRQVEAGKLPLLVFIFMLALVPTLFLLVMSFRNGHTYGITQRYSGFSFPFSVILVAMLVQQLIRVSTEFREILLAVLLIQSYFIARLLHRIYQDKAPKYTYFNSTREPNPYYLVAQKIRQSYVPGDTVLYPSIRLHPRDEIEKTYWPYSIQDAQLTNMYLPRDAEYLQRMDTTEVNKIILLKRSGQRMVLFDFKGQTHRY